jgi:hypothetical protein
VKNNSLKTRTLALHGLLWVVFLALPVFFSPTAHEMEDGRLPFHFYIPFIASSILLVVIYYLNYFTLTPRLFFPKKYIPYFLSIGALLFLLLLVPEIDHLFEQHAPRDWHPDQDGSHNGPPSAMGRLFHFSPFERQIFLMGILVLIVSTLMATVRRLRVAEQEKSKAELSFLKAQINPHFLFNTLNSIYSLANSKSDRAPSAIIKLSGLMRHVITDAQKDEVPLSQEIDYIANYIELQKLRLTDSTSVEFDVRGETDDKSLAPLIFLPFIENAFKYGSNPERDSRISIRIETGPSFVQLEVKNTIVNSKDVQSERIGVGNSIERLELVYPGRHLLNISHTDSEYSVSLHIHLK